MRTALLILRVNKVKALSINPIRGGELSDEVARALVG